MVIIGVVLVMRNGMERCVSGGLCLKGDVVSFVSDGGECQFKRKVMAGVCVSYWCGEGEEGSERLIRVRDGRDSFVFLVMDEMDAWLEWISDVEVVGCEDVVRKDKILSGNLDQSVAYNRSKMFDVRMGIMEADNVGVRMGVDGDGSISSGENGVRVKISVPSFEDDYFDVYYMLMGSGMAPFPREGYLRRSWRDFENLNSSRYILPMSSKNKNFVLDDVEKFLNEVLNMEETNYEKWMSFFSGDRTLQPASPSSWFYFRGWYSSGERFKWEPLKVQLPRIPPVLMILMGNGRDSGEISFINDLFGFSVLSTRERKNGPIAEHRKYIMVVLVREKENGSVVVRPSRYYKKSGSDIMWNNPRMKELAGDESDWKFLKLYKYLGHNETLELVPTLPRFTEDCSIRYRACVVYRSSLSEFCGDLDFLCNTAFVSVRDFSVMVRDLSPVDREFFFGFINSSDAKMFFVNSRRYCSWIDGKRSQEEEACEVGNFHIKMDYLLEGYRNDEDDYNSFLSYISSKGIFGDPSDISGLDCESLMELIEKQHKIDDRLKWDYFVIHHENLPIISKKYHFHWPIHPGTKFTPRNTLPELLSQLSYRANLVMQQCTQSTN